uniref:Chaperonin containing TCP1 subunit 7 n=1 Tax=Mus musculus TaxID=10090 RepID=A0A0N4SV22_MOUSE
MMPTPVILLKEGTDSSQGIPQLVSNISACQVIAEAVRTTLGPRGMDKLIVDGRVSEAGEALRGRRFTPSDHHPSFPHSHPIGC